MNKSSDILLLNVGDYLADTMDFNGVEHGAYLLLLMCCIVEGKLPNDRGILARISRLDVSKWVDIEKKVLEKFFEIDDFFYIKGKNQPKNFVSRYIKSKKITKRSLGSWIYLRKIVFERDGFTCQYCFKKTPKLECDHVVPVSKGGSNSLSNLVSSCVSCNRKKGSKTISEWKKNASSRSSNYA